MLLLLSMSLPIIGMLLLVYGTHKGDVSPLADSTFHHHISVVCHSCFTRFLCHFD